MTSRPKLSSLRGYSYRLVGYCFIPHPTQYKIQVTFFHQVGSQKYQLCMSDVTPEQEQIFPLILDKQLGDVFGADEVIPYVKRGIENADYATFQEAINQGFEMYNTKIKWWAS